MSRAVVDPLVGFDLPAREPGANPVALPDNYPGSKRPRSAVVRRKVVEDQPSMFGVKAKMLRPRGAKEPEPFYMVGVLAQALEREVGTVRKWLQLGFLPDARYVTKGKTERGKKRLWSEREIKIIVRVAKEEGLVGVASYRRVSSTRFPDRVRDALTSLYKAQSAQAGE
jgi:hypothetical protein